MAYPTTKTHRKTGRIARYFVDPDNYADEGEPILVHFTSGTDVCIERESGGVEFVNAHHVIW